MNDQPTNGGPRPRAKTRAEERAEAVTTPSRIELAERVGLTPANVAVLKNGRAKAVRFSTLEAMCRVLECQPGDLLEYVED